MICIVGRGFAEVLTLKKSYKLKLVEYCFEKKAQKNKKQKKNNNKKTHTHWYWQALAQGIAEFHFSLVVALPRSAF